MTSAEFSAQHTSSQRTTMADGQGGWCTIESDPGVFTELISTIGVKGMQVEELFSTDDDSFDNLSPVHGLVFLFKWTKETQTKSGAAVPADSAQHIYFANQVINNACATQAIISILMNLKDVALGPHLSEFKAMTNEFPAEMKGLALSNSDLIRESHNSFHRPDPFVMEDGPKTSDEDPFHFIAYVPIDGHLYELDGLQQGPIHHGAIADPSKWWKTVQPVIQERIERYSATEIHFNLLAVVSDRKEEYLKQLAPMSATLEFIRTQAVAKGVAADNVPANPAATLTVPAHPLADSEQTALSALDGPELLSRAGGITAQMSQLVGAVADEVRKAERWAKENRRRRHNFMPFIVNLLKALADNGSLPALVEKGTAKAKARQEREAAAKKAGK